MTMPDLDRLMQALECIHNGGKGDCERRECQYGFCGFAPCNVAEIAGDALEVLKEQEIVPYVDIDEAKCPDCKVKLTRQELLGEDVLFEDFYDYCPHCGKRVKWNA